MNQEQFAELLLQSLEHEMGGVKVYETALQSVVNDDRKEEWEEYLEQTRNHVGVLQGVCNHFQIDPAMPTPDRDVVCHTGLALVEAMKMALKAGRREAAQLVACECVVLAETKDHADWQLLMKCAEEYSDTGSKEILAAMEEVEEEEGEHLFHTKGWCRELWLESLGMQAMLTPPEEEKEVTTAIGAARAARGRQGANSEEEEVEEVQAGAATLSSRRSAAGRSGRELESKPSSSARITRLPRVRRLHGRYTWREDA